MISDHFRPKDQLKKLIFGLFSEISVENVFLKIGLFNKKFGVLGDIPVFLGYPGNKYTISGQFLKIYVIKIHHEYR